MIDNLYSPDQILALHLAPVEPGGASFFASIYQPQFLVGAKRGTLAIYKATLNYWRRLTRNPSLAEIATQDLAEFKTALLDPERQQQMLRLDTPPKQLSRATVNKHIRNIRAMLNCVGPRTPQRPDALGVLQEVPFVRRVKEPKRRPRPVEPETLGAIYKACDVAQNPRLDFVTPADWWRALVFAAYHTGFRRGALLTLRQADVNWRRAEIRVEAEEDKCGEERLKPISVLLLKHLLRCRTDSELMFPWPHSYATWYRDWHLIQDAAGLETRAHVKFHQLKASCGTVLAESGASAWCVQSRLDHAFLATSTRYINASQEERSFVERMPVPAEFREGFEPNEEPAAARPGDAIAELQAMLAEARQQEGEAARRCDEVERRLKELLGARQSA